MKSKVIFYHLKIEVPDDTKVVALYYGELMYIVYDSPYCWLHFTGNKKYKVETTLQYMLDNLPIAFIRCNKSVILNVFYYEEYDQTSLMVRMNDGMKFKFARRRVRNFNETKLKLLRISPPCVNCYVCTNEKCENRMGFCLPEKVRY